jgi:peptidyl-tRNA hydrolase
MNVRQSVVVRKDLNMSAGLLAAQVAHISAKFVFDTILKNEPKWSIAAQQWFGSPTISVLAVDNPEELEYLIKQAKEKKVEVNVWKDTIKSSILNDYLYVVVGASFGPDDEELIKQITGTLPIYP